MWDMVRQRLRSALPSKQVQEGKQVVYLVPTILAQQHYNTFVQRMKDFPVNIALMSRFRTSSEIKKTVKDLEKGMVDIVIGTHRVLSEDVKFKDLGLLIIDEEQRFGVAHKEKIKKLKENVDVLTLTATPIPRTLHEPDRYPGYERAGGGSQRQAADPDFCLRIQRRTGQRGHCPGNGPGRTGLLCL